MKEYVRTLLLPLNKEDLSSIIDEVTDIGDTDKKNMLNNGFKKSSSEMFNICIMIFENLLRIRCSDFIHFTPNLKASIDIKEVVPEEFENLRVACNVKYYHDNSEIVSYEAKGLVLQEKNPIIAVNEYLYHALVNDVYTPEQGKQVLAAELVKFDKSKWMYNINFHVVERYLADHFDEIIEQHLPNIFHISDMEHRIDTCRMYRKGMGMTDIEVYDNVHSKMYVCKNGVRLSIKKTDQENFYQSCSYEEDKALYDEYKLVQRLQAQ